MVKKPTRKSTVAKKSTRKPGKPPMSRLLAVATQKLSPLDIVQEKITIVSDSLNYLAQRPGGAGYTTAEDADINVQFNRFNARLSDLNDQLAAVIADASSVNPPSQTQIQAMLDAADNLAHLNRDEAIASATVNFLDSAFSAAQPLAKP